MKSIRWSRMCEEDQRVKLWENMEKKRQKGQKRKKRGWNRDSKRWKVLRGWKKIIVLREDGNLDEYFKRQTKVNDTLWHKAHGLLCSNGDCQKVMIITCFIIPWKDAETVSKNAGWIFRNLKNPYSMKEGHGQATDWFPRKVGRNVVLAFWLRAVGEH